MLGKGGFSQLFTKRLLEHDVWLCKPMKTRLLRFDDLQLDPHRRPVFLQTTLPVTFPRHSLSWL